MAEPERDQQVHRRSDTMGYLFDQIYRDNDGALDIDLPTDEKAIAVTSMRMVMQERLRECLDAVDVDKETRDHIFDTALGFADDIVAVAVEFLGADPSSPWWLKTEGIYGAVSGGVDVRALDGIEEWLAKRELAKQASGTEVGSYEVLRRALAFLRPDMQGDLREDLAITGTAMFSDLQRCADEERLREAGLDGELG